MLHELILPIAIENDVFKDTVFDTMHLLYERCGYNLMISFISLLSPGGAVHLLSRMQAFRKCFCMC